MAGVFGAGLCVPEYFEAEQCGRASEGCAGGGGVWMAGGGSAGGDFIWDGIFGSVSAEHRADGLVLAHAHFRGGGMAFFDGRGSGRIFCEDGGDLGGSGIVLGGMGTVPVARDTACCYFDWGVRGTRCDQWGVAGDGLRIFVRRRMEPV